MLFPGLHSLGGHNPHGRVEVHLAPSGTPSFGTSNGSEHQELEQQLDSKVRIRPMDCADRIGDQMVRDSSIVRPAHVVGLQRPANRLTSGILGDVAVGDRPVHDESDAPPQLAGQVALDSPNRHQDVQYVSRLDIYH